MGAHGICGLRVCFVFVFSNFDRIFSLKEVKGKVKDFEKLLRNVCLEIMNLFLTIIPRPSCKQFHLGTIFLLPNYTVSLHRWKCASAHECQAMT